MSLINNLLKDLEKREKQETLIPYVTLTQERAIRKYKWPKKISLFAMVAAALSILTIGLIFKTEETPRLAPPLSYTETTSPLQYQLDEKWLKPAEITGITLQVKDAITEFSLLLNHVALYRVFSHNKIKTLSIMLDHTELQAPLPLLDYPGNAIQKIKTENVNGDTKIDLVFKPQAEIESISLNEDDNPTLTIAFRLGKPLSKDNVSPAPIKTPAFQSYLIQQYQAALALAEKNDYNTALDHLALLLKIDPHYKDARLSLAALLIDQGKIIKAKEILNSGLEESPDYIPFIELKARALATEGKEKEALTLLQAMPPSLPDNPEYHAFMAALYEHTNNDALAVKLYKKLLLLKPDNGNWWFGLGVSLEKMGDSKAAQNAYLKALAAGHLSIDSASYIEERLQNIKGGDRL